MKVFKYRFTKLIYSLMGVCLALCVAGFAYNTYQVIAVGLSIYANQTFTILHYILMYFVTVALFVILISIIAHSNYSVKGKNFYTNFGFIRSKYDIEKIDEITLDRKQDKLRVIFKDETFIVIVVKPEWYEDFIQAILDVNPAITYSINSLESGDNKDTKN